MSDPSRKPLNTREVQDETQRAASDRLREIMMRRARQAPAVSTGVGNAGSFQYERPEETMQRGSDQMVYVDAPNGGVQQKGIDMYVAGTDEPADMDALNQDWGDGGSAAQGGGYSASNPDGTRSHTLDETVRHEPTGYVARDASGEDTQVPEDQTSSYMQDMEQGPAYEPGDNETREFLARRLREEANKNEPTAIARRP